MSSVILWARDSIDESMDYGFPLTESLTLAAFESVSYCLDLPSVMLWNCTRCRQPKIAGFLPEETAYDKLWDVFALVGYFPKWKAIIVAFRGTNSDDLRNWIFDFAGWKAKHPLPFPGAEGVKVHAGFHRLWVSSDLKKLVTAAVSRLVSRHGIDVTTHVVGHSMGAAVADLCALWLKFHLGLVDVRVTTFGQPRTGNKEYAEFYNKTIPHSWRFTHNKDIVPTLPFESMGYWHTPREVWQVDVHLPMSSGMLMTFTTCDESGEDPTCHDSVSGQSIFWSPDDHITYLGYHLFRNLTLC